MKRLGNITLVFFLTIAIYAAIFWSVKAGIDYTIDRTEYMLIRVIYTYQGRLDKPPRGL